MAATVTLSDLRARARARADMEKDDATNGFSRDTIIDPMINVAMYELDDLLIATFEHYRTAKTDISVVSGTYEYSLPADFYKNRGVELKLSSAAGDFVPLRRFDWNDRGRYAKGTAYWSGNVGPFPRYSIQGDKLVLLPVPDAAATVTLHYVPVLAKLVNAGDTYDAIHGFEEYIVVDVAAKLLAREESDNTHLLAEKAALIRRIEAMAANRDAEQPARMRMTHGSPYDGPSIDEWVDRRTWS